MDWYDRAQRVFVTLIALCVCAPGCANLRIDPSGRSLFTTTPSGAADLSSSDALPLAPQRPGVALLPQRVIAPVGSEVVLVATLHGLDGLPSPNQKIEWLLTPDSAGYFVAPNGREASLFFGSYSNQARKVTNNYAIGSTLNSSLAITRGTASSEDDLTVGPGQSWIVVASPTEGSSYVSAYGPQVADWTTHLSSATIHWVDAQWTPPASAVNPSGSSGTLTTSVTRQSDGSPVQGWRVRYEIVSGPPVGFAPDGAPMVEVATNELGQATAEIRQAQSATGTNQIKVELIRPAELAFSDQQPLLIGSTTVDRTWTSPDISLRVSGPTQAAIGTPSTYRLQISNPGSLPARNAVITAELPQGFSFIGSVPQPEASDQNLTWRIAEIPPRQTQAIEVQLQAASTATGTLCADVQTAEGLTARDCVTTTVTAASLELSVAGPQQARVGDTLTYEVTVRNRGGSAATGLLLLDKFSEGLSFIAGPGAEIDEQIERDLDDLPAGGAQTATVAFRTAAQGRHCQNIEVRDSSNRVLAATQYCVDVVATATVGQSLTVAKQVQPTARVGETVLFTTEIRNDGPAPINGIRVADEYALSLHPGRATEGFADTGELIWEISTLMPGQSRLFEVECACAAVDANACARVEVTSGSSGPIVREACVDIQPAGGAAEGTTAAYPPKARQAEPSDADGISLQLTSTSETAALGEQFECVVVITNVGSESQFDTALTVTLPARLELVSVAQGPTALADQSSGILKFAPVAELRPLGDRVEYRLSLRTIATATAGTATIGARVESRDVTIAVSADQAIDITGAKSN